MSLYGQARKILFGSFRAEAQKQLTKFPCLSCLAVAAHLSGYFRLHGREKEIKIFSMGLSLNSFLNINFHNFELNFCKI